jgi:hypothetical protein
MANRNLLLLFCFFLFSTNLSGQTWTRTYGDAPDSSYFFKQILRTSDGGMLMVGSALKFAGGRHLYVVKTDKNGASQWQKTYKNIKVSERVKCVALSNSGYSIMGSFAENELDTSRIFFTKIDALGNQTDFKLLGEPMSRNWFAHGSIAKDNNLMVYSDEREMNGSAISRFVRIYKLTPQGDTIWTKRFPNLFSSFTFSNMKSFVQMSDNGFAISVDSFTSTNQLAPRLLKIAENGDFQWSKTGRSEANKTFLINNTIAVGSGFASALIDDQGNNIWSNPSLFPYFPGITSFTSGTLLTTQNNNLINVMTTTEVGPSKKIIVAKFNLLGQPLWANSWDLAEQTKSTYINDGIGSQTDSCFTVAGSIVTITPTASGTKAWAAQIGNCATTKTNDLSVATWSILVAQNPMLTESEIVINDAPTSISGNFQLFDVSGRLVMGDKFVGNRFLIERRNLNSGLYFLKIKTDDGKVGSQKIVIL